MSPPLPCVTCPPLVFLPARCIFHATLALCTLHDRSHTPRPLSPLPSPQTIMFAVALLCAIFVTYFMFVRVRRVRQAVMFGSSGSKVWYETAFCTLVLNVTSFALNLAATLITMRYLPPLADYYATVGLFTLGDFITQYGCPASPPLQFFPPLTYVPLAGGAYCAFIATFCAGLAMVLDFASHCFCKTHADAHLWWELPKPPGLVLEKEGAAVEAVVVKNPAAAAAAVKSAAGAGSLASLAAATSAPSMAPAALPPAAPAAAKTAADTFFE
jgi:hypothetical protein